MNRAMLALSMALLSCGVSAAQSQSGNQPSERVEVRIEALANRDAGPAEACEVVQATSGNPLSFWSAFGEAGPSEKSGFQVRNTSAHCGNGGFHVASLMASGAASAPMLIHEISAAPGFEPGAMDPGPGVAVQVILTVTSRQLSGFSPEGEPLYGNRLTDTRTVRLEPGEEFILPVVALDVRAREVLGIREVLLRVRAGWADRPGATEYGAVAITAAAPGSEILLDGGLVGHVGADGNFVLPTVPVGQREVRIRNGSGSSISRWVTVVRGKTVAVSPEAAGIGPSQPVVTSAGKNPEGFPEYRRSIDGAVMVQIPEGEFLMGNRETEGSPLPHRVNLSSFLMDKLPVTVGLFKHFSEATGHPLPPDPYWGVHDDFPVAFVRWDEGKAYCEWAGGRLPTEAEREKAARGTDGRLWPWGNEPPPTPDRGVFRRNWGELGNDKVGIRPAGTSPYGLLDTGGNMWEWVEDWWDADYFKTSPKENPPGPKTGRARVVKGGSWDSRPTVLSASSRNFGYTGYREGDYGFRCAADVPR